ncbi:MAG TPA: hypothetical protein VFK16_11745 [Gemmatimonadaceae bacterium]|nr:hypothetical protein [Gemmatimonadaceae bacterium]
MTRAKALAAWAVEPAAVKRPVSREPRRVASAPATRAALGALARQPEPASAPLRHVARSCAQHPPARP